MNSQAESSAPSADSLAHPECEAIDLLIVLRALGDPTRLEIVRLLAASGDEIACGAFGLEATKQNLSHHFRVLREAGVTRTRDEGRSRLTSLRKADLDARFPGLIAAVVEGSSRNRSIAY